MTSRIVVINPNSSSHITAEIDSALEPLRRADGPEISCLTLAEGPPGIETQAHIDGVVAPLCDLVQSQQTATAVFVIACFSDPGLEAVRRTTRRPALGIARCGLMTARALAERVGVISILQASVPRHQRLYEQLGVAPCIAGDRAVGLGVVELAQEAVALPRLREVGEALKRDGARTLVLGCTGMTRYRARLEADLAVPVVDPTLAATGMAIALASATLVAPSRA